MVNAAAILVLAMAAMTVAEQTEAQRQAQQAVTAANNAFSFDLYKLMRSTPGNLIASPLSAGAVLALLAQGAGGRTAQELRTALHLPDDAAAVRLGYQALFAALQSNEDMELRIANKVYPRKGSEIKEPFRRTAVDFFRADAQELDYARDPNGAKQIINSWVEELTNGKIKNLIDTLDESTLMVLVNAIYFKGKWVSSFPESDTQTETFHKTPTTQVQVPMMHLTENFNHAPLPDLGAHLLELPYKGGSMKMMIILPDAIDGLARVEENLHKLNFDQIKNQMSFDEIILTMPKFKTESKFKLHELLPQLGINELFANANLTGLTDENVSVSQVVQKAFVEVSEKGTEAAAATGVQVILLSAPQPREQVFFTADHPFLYLIMNGSNIIFIGRTVLPQI